MANRQKNRPWPSIPIVVAFGLDLNHYLKAGRAVITLVLVRCPVCVTQLCGNGWGRRVVKVRSTGYGPPWWIPVHRMYCPACRKAGRHPWNFTLLPNFLAPYKHFLQSVRWAVFRLHWEAGQSIRALSERFEIDLAALAAWVRQTATVLRTAVPEVAGELIRVGGDLPRGLLSASTEIGGAMQRRSVVELVRAVDDLPAGSQAAAMWRSWCYLALGLQLQLSGDACLCGGGLLEWFCSFACRRRQPAWSP